MSSALTRPDFKADIADLARRIGILERRLQPRTNPATASVNIDGTGDHAIAAAHSGDTATGSGYYVIAIGTNAVADGAEAIAIGGGESAPAAAHADHSVAIGPNTLVTGSHTNSVAIGTGSWTRVANQVTTGALRVMMGTPNSAPADDDIGGNQASFYLEESFDLLHVKVKYSDGTVKTGAISLS